MPGVSQKDDFEKREAMGAATLDCRRDALADEWILRMMDREGQGQPISGMMIMMRLDMRQSV
jgi:hypothetical protein